MEVCNPILPSWEYIPDAEPYVFGDRLYLYGSHDRFNGRLFCLNDYVCWSAPLKDLSAWTCSGVIYRKNQDPMNRLGLRILFAPDVARGADGRYYLFYAFDFLGVIGVAVCDTPDGTYEFYGHIRYPDGRLWGRKKGDEFPFDPAVLVDDDGRVYLYSGFGISVPGIASRFHSHQNSGCVVLELEPDMLTIRTGPKLLLPLKGSDVPEDFRDHEFFEASSIRKIDGRYILVYSSVHNHELCWAFSDHPDSGYRFGGTLVDQGDLYLDGNTDEAHARNYLGNTHGGMVKLDDQWFIFYHRQTNRHSYSRQACAERLERTADGGFRQAEVTSCGLNRGPLPGRGTYPAYIACHLWSGEGTGRVDVKRPRKALAVHPYFTQDKTDGETDAVSYIANMRDGSVAGFRYFEFRRLRRICLVIGGVCEGVMEVSEEPAFSIIYAAIPVKAAGNQTSTESALLIPDGNKSLYFRFRGTGKLDFYTFTLE